MALPHYNFYDMTLVEPRFIAANKSKGSIKFKYPHDESRGYISQKNPVASRFIAMKKKKWLKKF